ncbi:tol-pal system YbgF family protein [Amycolatopsis samaneae]|uniref:Uncharacterized protein n=1 Tax=Amycolatopsis samaneae TaxID=664691 RepID=A0ABW5GTY4_9PSEU
MEHPPYVPPEEPPARRSHDPVAVALGNASLVGVGYLLLRRRWFAVLTGLVTIALVTLLVTVARTVWFEFVVLLWWIALIAHGWFLARRGADRVVRRKQRLIALAVTVPVLLAVGFLRFDAARIEGTVTEARATGDCARADAALGRVWFGHRVADAPMTVRGEGTTRACARIRDAKTRLATALTGDIDSLKTGFDELGTVLARQPGHEKMVGVALDGFLAGLPAKDPCHTAVITDWISGRHNDRTVLDRAASVVPRTAPPALVGCGDQFAGAAQWEQARTRYQQLLDRYPGHELAAGAAEGVKKSTLALELANVRGLLGSSAARRPVYCDRPAQYGGAPAYAKGAANRALFYGDGEYPAKLPAEWRAGDVADAVLVVCLGDRGYGAPVQTCPYTSSSAPGVVGNVTFHKIAIPVRAYELRTGKLVTDTRVEIGGASCPQHFTVPHHVGGPPPRQYVSPSDADLRAGFAPVVR